jgi:lipoprotein signal peptidase
MPRGWSVSSSSAGKTVITPMISSGAGRRAGWDDAAMGVFVLSAITMGCADQLLKSIAVKVASTRIVGFTYRRNPNGGMAGVPLWAGLLTLAAAIACMVVVLALSEWALLMAIGLGTAAGGALSNFIDQRRRGCVIDYLALSATSAVNLADLAIGAGSALAVVSLFAS